MKMEYNMLYIIETIITMLFVLIGFIIISIKKKKGYLKLIIISLLIYIVAFCTTFILEKPKMNINNIETIEVNTNTKIPNPPTSYHFKDITSDVKILGEIDYNKIGEYSVEYKVKTLFGEFTKNGKVKIQDTKSPEITLEGDLNFRQSYKNEFTDPGYKAIDNYDGDVTKNVQITKEDIDELHYNIVYDVADLSGNKSQMVRKVTIIDDIPPVITLNGSENMTLYINDKYEEKGAKAFDEKDGDLTDKIEISGSVDTSKAGKHTIIYKVADKNQNVASKERTIVVKKEIVQQAQNTNSSSGKVIYLTFDDGPSSYTSTLLDILKRYNVKATFFVTGNGSDSVIKREFDEGHTVALHTNSHDYSYVYRSKDNFFKDLYAVQSRVERITGMKSYIMRFPGGSSNAVSKSYDGGIKIMSYLTKEVQNRGFRYFDWNVSSGDAGGTTSSDGVYNNVINTLKSGTSVVLQHDTKKFSIDAVPRIIEYGIENGYTFSKITENTPMVTHRVNN